MYLEWIYIISGTARATAFPGGTSARTFDFQAGDTGIFPVGWGHYVSQYLPPPLGPLADPTHGQLKNTSPDEPLIYLELWKAEKFIEFTAAQWYVSRYGRHFKR